MVGRQGDVQAILEQRARAQVGRQRLVVAKLVDDGEVELALARVLHALVGVRLVEHELDRRMALAQARDRARDEDRVITLGAVLGLYLLVCFVALGVLSGDALGASPARLAAAAARFGGAGARALVVFCALPTTAATANAVLVVTSRISFAMARDGIRPAPLAAVSGRTGAPGAALVVSALVLGVVAATASISFAAVGGFLYVLHFVVPLVALVALRRRGRLRSGAPLRTPAAGSCWRSRSPRARG